MQHFNEPQKTGHRVNAPFVPLTEEQKDALQTNVFTFLSPQGQQTVGEYLAHLEQGLARSDFASKALSIFERDDALREIQNHLASLIVAYQELGDDEPKAIRAALAQFGAARDIGNRLYQTGKRKRYAALVEVGLFSAAFSTLFLVIEQIGTRALQAVSLLPHPLFLDMQTTNWPLLGWPISWSIGVAALAILVLRWGTRGVVQKALGSTPTGAVTHFLFWVQVANMVFIVPSFFFIASGSISPTFWRGLSFEHLTSAQQTAIIFSSDALPLLFTFIVAYFVGRCSKIRESVADALGCAVTVGVVTGLLQMLFQFVPTPWVCIRPTPSVASFLTASVFGVLCVFVAYLGAQWGEKSRRPLVAVHKGF